VAFKFPESDPKPDLNGYIMSQRVSTPEALVLFREATLCSLRFCLDSFVLSFPDRKEVSLREVMQWIKAYYDDYEVPFKKNNI